LRQVLLIVRCVSIRPQLLLYVFLRTLPLLRRLSTDKRRMMSRGIYRGRWNFIMRLLNLFDTFSLQRLFDDVVKSITPLGLFLDLWSQPIEIAVSLFSLCYHRFRIFVMVYCRLRPVCVCWWYHTWRLWKIDFSFNFNFTHWSLLNFIDISLQTQIILNLLIILLSTYISNNFFNPWQQCRKGFLFGHLHCCLMILLDLAQLMIFL
jgi:hypothetical protein